jgi:uncharacterized protein YdaU (DUF1376 family)
MHYYQFNIGDYLSHTRHLTPMEDICYRRALDYYYLHEKPLTNDIGKLCRLLILPDAKAELLSVLDEFFVPIADGYINPRADKEIKQYQEFAEAGKRGAAIRWSKGDNSPPNSPLNPPPIANNKQEPLNNNHKPTTNKKPSREIALVVTDNFDVFWLAYPKKAGKDAAIKSWNKLKPNVYEVINALAWQKQSEQWQKNGGQYIPNPATYLNQGRWKDEPPIEELW